MDAMCLQNSWKFALQRKFKRERDVLFQEATVDKMRKKYSNPGKTGRKRKHPTEAALQEVESEISKVIRLRVCLLTAYLTEKLESALSCMLNLCELHKFIFN
jgi:hypothetical protein